MAVEWRGTVDVERPTTVDKLVRRRRKTADGDEEDLLGMTGTVPLHLMNYLSADKDVKHVLACPWCRRRPPHKDLEQRRCQVIGARPGGRRCPASRLVLFVAAILHRTG